MEKRRISLSHGSGGKLMHGLIKELFVKNFSNKYLIELMDSSRIDFKGNRFAYTTDSFVVKPLFFPGCDIGKLSICGTVNDLAVSGAKPLFLSCAMIVEDGFSMSDLERITLSMSRACMQAGVSIVTGDFKVVEKNSADKIFINTSGIGIILKDAALSINRIRPGDKIIINGTVGDHAMSVLIARQELKFKANISSDCSPLNGLIYSVLCGGIKFMRDPTRGGLVTTLNEISAASGYNIAIDESLIPVKPAVRELCEILGFDPLYMANEGKVVVIVSRDAAGPLLSKMKKHPLGKDSRIIGEVDRRKDKKVFIRTKIGGFRILDMVNNEQLPRIC